MEVVGLRKKGEKNEAFFKFKDNSYVLYKIFDFQISPCDKTGLVYKKAPEAGRSTSFQVSQFGGSSLSPRG